MSGDEETASSNLSPETLAVINEIMSHPNVFDPYAIDHDPIGSWLYVYREMKWLTPAQRHSLLRTIVTIRRLQGGKLDEERTNQMLADVLAGKAQPS